MKTLSFHVNLLTYISFYRLSTKLKQKYKIYHVNNLKSICYLNKNTPNYNRFHVNCYPKRLVIYYILFNINSYMYKFCYIVILGLRSLVIDKRDHIGGNCYDYVDQHGIR